MSRHVREATGRELTENELSQVAGGWSVDTLAAMAEAQKKGPSQGQGSGVSGGLSLSYGTIIFSYN
jgi:bacteriocin-like protein